MLLLQREMRPFWLWSNAFSYHSTPFFLEMNGTPEFRSVTGLMVDNYSQVAIDLGKNNSSAIGVATRFGTFDAYIMTDDSVTGLIWWAGYTRTFNYRKKCSIASRQYTSIVGRPKLKPRFILGHHQGCKYIFPLGFLSNTNQASKVMATIVVQRSMVS